MTPITRIALVAAVLAVAVGAAFLGVRTPSVGPPDPSSAAPSSVAPPSIEGTWDVTFTSQELLDAGVIPHVAEDPDDYGHFHLTFSKGLWQLSHLAPTSYVAEARPYTLEPGVVHLFSPGDTGEAAPYTVTATTLTFGPEATYKFRVKPWTRIVEEPIGTPRPFPSIELADVGATFAAGTFHVRDFAAPFYVTLATGWKLTDFSRNSFAVEDGSDASINVFLAVMDKVYPDPCHTTEGPERIEPSVDDLVAAFSAMPGFQVTDVTEVTVGGASGASFVITNTIDVAAANCSGNMLPLGTYERDGENVDIAMFGGETDTFWVLDTGSARVFMAVTQHAVGPTKTLRDSLLFDAAASP